jgi:hypothetical protein
MMGIFGARNMLRQSNYIFFSHLVGSLPFTTSTMHGHMNIKFVFITFVHAKDKILHNVSVIIFIINFCATLNVIYFI